MTANEDNVFKSTERLSRSDLSQSDFRKDLKNDIEGNLEKFNDPVVLGEMLYKLLEERENTNRILKNILTKLESLGTQKIEIPKEHLPQVLLPEIDEQILSYVKEKGKAIAEDVRARFQYKGTNAASARLNRLYEMGLLDKKQVGKKVFFFPVTG